MDIENPRVADHPIEKIFLDRWSPRAFTGEAIPEPVLMSIFEAARWAPSSYNAQPWRFLYATREHPAWEKFLGLLSEMNQSWAKNSAVIIFVVSETTFLVPGKDTRMASHTHSFDAGAATGALALQASQLGWHAHGMIGIDLDGVSAQLNVPAGYRVECGVVIGKRGDKTLLPPVLAAREIHTPRKPVTEIAFAGGF